MKKQTIATSLKQVIHIYHRRGFRVAHIHGDGRDEHVLAIERHI